MWSGTVTNADVRIMSSGMHEHYFVLFNKYNMMSDRMAVAYINVPLLPIMLMYIMAL